MSINLVLRKSYLVPLKDMVFPVRLVIYSIRSGCWW
jgi:hypothetical protein